MKQGGINRAALRRRGTPFGEAAGGSGVSFQSYRTKDQGAAFVPGQTRFHLWGLHSASGYSAATPGPMVGQTVQSFDGNGTGQMAIAIPQWFDTAGTIIRLLTRTNGTVGTAGTPRLKLAIYSDSTLAAGNFAGSPYPGSLLVQGSDQDVWSGAANRLFEDLISQAVTAGRRLWGVWACNAQAATNQHTVSAIRRNSLYPILGYTCDVNGPTAIATDNLSAGVGWRHAITYTLAQSFPDPFPQTAPVMLTTGATSELATIPAIEFGWVP